MGFYEITIIVISFISSDNLKISSQNIPLSYNHHQI